MNPTPSIIAGVLDMEGICEVAFANVFTANEIKGFTSQMLPRSGDKVTDDALEAAGFTLIDYQKDRPRAEIVVTLGAGQSRWIPHPLTGEEIETCWAFSAQITLVTEADIRIHTATRTLARLLMLTIRGRVNNVAPVTLHYINSILDAGTSPVMKPETGVFESRLAFNGGISVQNNAWPALLNPQ